MLTRLYIHTVFQNSACNHTIMEAYKRGSRSGSFTDGLNVFFFFFNTTFYANYIIDSFYFYLN